MIDRREFLGAAAAAGMGLAAGGPRIGAASGPASFELAEMTIQDLQEAMQKGELLALDIASHYLERIDDVDPQLNSMIEINPDALDLAGRMDQERKAGKVRGPLHGIPFVLKDNIDTADKMKTTAGSLALLGAPAPTRDAFIAERLREAGAVLLGKTNLSEWANFRSTNSVSGWSGRGGQTRNPYILDRNPCGSSSGTGSAISANLAAVGIGTETDGSIVCPSSICGIVGLKPTVGLVSRSGIIPIAHTQDTAGPMTRTVADAAILLNAIRGFDERDTATAALRGRAAEDYTRYLASDGLKNARIGVARDHWGKRADVDKVMGTALDAMRSAGATLIDVRFPTLGKFNEPEFEVLLFEFKADLEKYLTARGAEHRTLAELIQFNEDNAAREMPHFKQEIFEMAAKKGPLTDRAYLQALKKCGELTRRKGIDAIVDKERLDAVVAPSNAPTWMIDLVNGDCGSNYVSSSSLAAVAGYPNISVPAGIERELPIGISFFGKAFTEGKLIRLAYAFEQTTKARRQPKFIATAA